MSLPEGPPRAQSASSSRLDGRELAKFTSAVALLAIFADAALGHGLLWENDPYWTYWITKTFLIATVFGVGTAWLGTGVGRGAVIAAVHTVVLTVYYWTLSPIGLPSHPHWLDLEHTWVTGVPVHFAVIYSGYLLALWLWRRRQTGGEAAAGRALLVGLGIVAVAGGLAAVALEEFQGFTWYLVRLLITAPFLLAWWALAGRDRQAAVTGGVLLALMWAAYGHFLGPNGLPDAPLRITEQAPPPAAVEWLGYRELWLVSLPIYLVVSVGAMLATASRGPDAMPPARAGAVVAVLVVPLLVGLALVDPHGDDAQLQAVGTAQVERGGWFSDSFATGQAELRLQAQDRGGRATPLPPHDELRVEARVSRPGGPEVRIAVDRPLVQDPLGRHGTWWGVGLDVWHHGDSGIGSVPPGDVHSDVAVYGSGEVRVGGELRATGVPVHVMTVDNVSPPRLELHVGDEQTPVPALADGHLRVVWPQFTAGPDANPKWGSRHLVGTVVLGAILALLLGATMGAGRRGR